MSKSVRKTPAKKSASRKPANNASLKAPTGIQLLTLESNIPLPARGERDPEFNNKIRELLNTIKKGQSFVIPKHKLHAVKKIGNNEFSSYKIKSAIILPDKKFSRVWRTA